MRNAVFVLGSFTFTVLLLAACVVSGSRGTVNEITVPTLVFARVVSLTETLVAASVTTVPTSAPTATIFLSPTRTATFSPTETAVVPTTPTFTGFHLSGYPDPSTTTPIPPSPTPALSADGQWEIINVVTASFESPVEWYNQPWEGWYANFLPVDGPLPKEEFDRGLIRTEFREDSYYHYQNYQFNGLEPLTVGGYPAYQRRGLSEWGDMWNFVLIVEGHNSIYYFSIGALFHPEASEELKQEFYANGERVFEHLIETFEIVGETPIEIAIAGTVEFTATVESVDEANQVIHLVPAANYTYNDILVPKGGVYITRSNSDSSIILKNVTAGMMITVRGRPLSETRLRGDVITVIVNE